MNVAVVVEVVVGYDIAKASKRLPFWKKKEARMVGSSL